MTLAELGDEIPDGLPPSALYVLRVLIDEGSWMTPESLSNQTLLPDSTLYYALDRLEAEDLIKRRPDRTNPGKREFCVEEALQYLER